MADAAPKLTLDKAGLQDFLDHQIAPFQDSLSKITQDDPTFGPTLANVLPGGYISPSDTQILGMLLPLSIGQMNGTTGGLTNGNALNTKLTSVAQSVINVFTAQTKLFKDLHNNLGTTIATLFDAQHTNLQSIDGTTFLDDLGNLPDDFQPSSSGSGSGSGN